MYTANGIVAYQKYKCKHYFVKVSALAKPDIILK